jgi:hypothetical protein
MENKDMNLFDFIVFCSKALWRFLCRSGVFVLEALRFGLRYSWVIVPFALLGVLAGWFWSKPSSTRYKGNATVTYVEGIRDVVNDGLVDFFVSSRSEKKAYGLTDEDLDALVDVRFYNVIDCNADSVGDYVDRDGTISLADTVNLVMRDRTHIVITLLGTTDFDRYEKALKEFLSSRDYIVSADGHCRKLRSERLDYLTREVARLDSFSTYDYFERNEPSRMELVNTRYYTASDKDLHYGDILSVLSQKQYLERQELSTPDVVNFQTPFIPYAMSELRKYFYMGLIGVMMGFAVALCVKYWKVIVDYMKER